MNRHKQKHYLSALAGSNKLLVINVYDTEVNDNPSDDLGDELTDRQTDRRTDGHDRKHYLPAFAGGNKSWRCSGLGNGDVLFSPAGKAFKT